MRAAHPRKMGSPGECGIAFKAAKSLWRNFTKRLCVCYEAGISPSIFKEGHGIGVARRWRIPLNFSRSLLSWLFFWAGAVRMRPSWPQAETNPQACVPEDIQLAAKALLGSESQVLAFGDLAKNGKRIPCGGCRAKDAKPTICRAPS